MIKESKVRDFLAVHFDDFEKSISNLKSFKKSLEKEKEKIAGINRKKKTLQVSELIKLNVIDKMLLGLPLFKHLELAGKEFQLLDTPSGRGKQPAIDLLAYDRMSFTIALIELKISDSAEREAITELSAYSQGLQNRFHGLSNLETLWLPISTEWRTTTKSAMVFSLLWQNALGIPLKMAISPTDNGKDVAALDLQCFNPIAGLKEEECRNLFSYECFDAFDYCTQEPIGNNAAFVNFVTGLCNRHNINGFVVFHKPVDLMFPYGFTLCIYNPFKGNLHKHISSHILNRFGRKEYNKAIRSHCIINEDFFDVDFKTNRLAFWDMDPFLDAQGSLAYDAGWDKDFLAVSEFMHRCDSPNISLLIKELKRAIDGKFENKRAFGAPNFHARFGMLNKTNVCSVMYFGLHLDLISRKISVEQQRGEINDDFFETIASISYLKEVFRQYNQ